MKNIIRITSFIFASLTQLCLLVTPFVIESLTKKKAGVNHHVIFKRVQYENGIFSPSNLSIQSIIVAIVGVMFVMILINTIKNKKTLYNKVQILLGFVLCLAVLFVINSSMFYDKIAYPYFIIAFIGALLIQMLIVIVANIFNKI